MRNAQLKPGYNVQIGVDSEYIVAADIFQDRKFDNFATPPARMLMYGKEASNRK